MRKILIKILVAELDGNNLFTSETHNFDDAIADLGKMERKLDNEDEHLISEEPEESEDEAERQETDSHLHRI